MKTVKNLILKCFYLLCMFAFAPNVMAADVNGYTAEYECRAGGPNCNVDVATLAVQACDQTITAAAAWSTINWSNNVICLQNGDHTAKGTLTLGSSGTAGTRKILRYTRTSDSDDEPWNQASRAVLHSINTDGNDYWIIHRITVDRNETTSGSTTTGIFVGIGSQNNIINRVLVQKVNGWGVGIQGNYYTSDTSFNYLQNSVVRTMATPGPISQENQCIATINVQNTRIVNNELYDCNKGSHTSSNSSNEGTVLENNDIYLSSAGRTDCNGNYSPTGNCGVMEALISWKTGGDAGFPAMIIHNRLWGVKSSDGNLVQVGDSIAISLSNETGEGARYVLVQNNILTDNDVGIWNYYGGPDHNSIIGNIIYDVHGPSKGGPGELGWCFRYRGLDEGSGSTDNFEYYLNTCIKATDAWFSGVDGSNHDIRCNVAINSGASDGATGTGVEKDFNAYYGTTPFSGGTNIVKSLPTRTSVTNYPAGSAMQSGPESGCVNGTESACSIFYTVAGGVSGNSAPSYCSGLGCTFVDGTVTWTKIRDTLRLPTGALPKRKLRTVAAGEDFVIPRASMDASAPEATLCPNTLGCRAGIGINEDHRAGC